MIDRDKYNDLVERLADELIDGYMEKTAAGSLVDYVKGKRDFSDPDDQRTKFWKDRYGAMWVPAIAASPFSGLARGPMQKHIMNSLEQFDMEKAINEGPKSYLSETGKYLGRAMRGAHKDPRYLAPFALSEAAVLAVNNARGRNLAATNNTDWSAKDVAKTLVPLVTPDAIVKKKLRQQNAVKEAAEALVGAIFTKQATMEDAFEADLYVEASEKALNSLGYSMFAEEE